MEVYDDILMIPARKNKLPTISIVTPTFNSGSTLDRCLKLVRSQNYPQNKIEIILGDGGSTDDTFKIAKKYKAKIIKVPTEKQHAEYNRGVAFNRAKRDLVLILDHDNFLPYKNWLQDMIEPFLENPKLVACETCYYQYDPKYTILDRYFALFGTSEPLPYFLGKADRMPRAEKKWCLQGKARDMGRYYLVKFEKDPRKIPSIGTNGCLMRRNIVSRYADVRPEYHYPIDVMVDLIKKGHNEFAFVKSSIIHLTNSRGFWEFIKRRKKFVEHYHFQDSSKRRWSVVMSGDQFGVMLYVIYSLTLIGPVITSIKGFFKIPDIAWFIHPLMCFGTTFMYGTSTLRYKLKI